MDSKGGGQVEERKPFQSKLTPTQRDAIFDGYVEQPSAAERRHYTARAAEEYGVSIQTIHRITRDKKRMKRWLDSLNHAYDLASGQILQNLGAAVRVQTDLITREDLPVNMLGLKQNAAVDLMNRAGLKKKDEDANQLVIKFETSGFEVGMPPASEASEE
jgi:hypothetical protein